MDQGRMRLVAFDIALAVCEGGETQDPQNVTAGHMTQNFRSLVFPIFDFDSEDFDSERRRGGAIRLPLPRPIEESGRVPALPSLLGVPQTN